MSGGVDSSTAAALLKEQGHEVIGIGLRLSEPRVSGEATQMRGGPAGMEEARRVAAHLGIPFYVLNYEPIFEKSVVDYFCRSYLEGKTPNPCVECNRVIKFGRLFRLADTLGADGLATGHYARVCQDPGTGRYLLKKGVDPDKDQSYFLYPIPQPQLSRLIFPLGEMTKEQTRQRARAFGLPVSDRPGSQDICFLGDGDYRQLLAERFPESLEPGPIVNARGEVLGRHRGIAGYTVGQRRGLHVAAGVPLYVLAVDAAKRTVTVGTRDEARRRRISVGQINWLAFDSPQEPLQLAVKLRYRQPELPATVSPLDRDRAEVCFPEPQPTAAPGQSAVFYDGDVVVGGGVIE